MTWPRQGMGRGGGGWKRTARRETGHNGGRACNGAEWGKFEETRRARARCWWRLGMSDKN